MSDDLLARILEMHEMLRLPPDAPPVAQAVLVSHSVPWGKVYRQWSTLAKLYVWCNPGWLMDYVQTRRPVRDAEELRQIAFDGGIPVIDMDEQRRYSRG